MSIKVQADGGADELLVILDGAYEAGNLVIANVIDKGCLTVTTASTSGWSAAGSFFLSPAAKTVKYNFGDILNARIDDTQGVAVVINVVDHRKGRKEQIRGQVDQGHLEHAKAWTARLMSLAYAGVRPYKRIKTLVNPASGVGKARKLWETQLQPIFEAAGCKVDVEFTTAVGHAQTIVEQMAIDDYDAIASMSGDGTIHEIINGLAHRTDALRALRLPIGVIPTGSGNALAACMMGPEQATSLSQAALTIIKGRPLAMDVLSVTQGEKRFFSFLSQAFGLMADVDVGTDHQRWLGSSRFVLAYLAGAVAQRAYACELALRIVEDDKTAMKNGLRADASTSKHTLDEDDRLALQSNDGHLGMPALRFGTVNDPLPTSSIASKDGRSMTSSGWTTFDEHVSSIYAGNIPYMATTLLQFPMARPDGLLDVVVQPVVGRVAMLQAVDGSEVGKHVDLPSLRYYKVEAMRLTPKGIVDEPDRKRWLAVDGEVVPYEAFQVEAHKGLARVLSRLDDWYLPPDWAAKR